LLYPTGIETADCNPSTTTSASPHINDRIQLVDIRNAEDLARASIKSDSFKPCYQRCSQHARIVPALWKHCDDEHHSWAEAVKRMLWQAEQLEAMPLLPPDKRRIIQSCARKVIIVYSIRTRLTVLFATTLTSTKDTKRLKYDADVSSFQQLWQH